MVGSAAAVTEDGHIIVGYQDEAAELSTYAYAAGEVILVVGHQKGNLEEGLRRVDRDPAFPREWVRMQGIGYPGTRLSKILIINYEGMNRITVILVNEALGF